MEDLKAGTDLTLVPLNNQLDQNNALVQFREQCQNFNRLLNTEPRPEAIDKTPDGNAKTILISHVEMQLDDLFFGLWSTENFKWSVIANEVVGSLELVVTHPVTGKELRRTGAGGIIITVNKAPDNLTPQERSIWANNPENKKANALDLGFPKLKAECLKNAALSLGKNFGRDINRKEEKKAFAKPLKTNSRDKAEKATAAAKQALTGTDFEGM